MLDSSKDFIAQRKVVGLVWCGCGSARGRDVDGSDSDHGGDDSDSDGSNSDAGAGGGGNLEWRCRCAGQPCDCVSRLPSSLSSDTFTVSKWCLLAVLLC